MERTRKQASAWTLEVLWLEFEGSEALPACRGQLTGAIGKLAAVRDDLRQAATTRDLATAFSRAESQLSTYFGIVYSLKDRVLVGLRLATGADNNSRRLRNPRTRETYLLPFRHRAPAVTDAALNLLALLDEDVWVRNRDVHEAYFQMGLYTGDDIFEPQDVITDAWGRTPATMTRMRQEARAALRTFCEQRADKTQNIIDATLDYVCQLDVVTLPNRSE